MPADFLQRLMRRAVRTEPIGAIFKVGFEDRLQYQQGRHLHHPVPHRRNPQRSHLSVGFRYVHAAHWLRPGRFSFAALPGSLQQTRSRPLPALRSVRSTRRPRRVLPGWLAPASMPLPVCPADRSGRTARKTGTSVPASPSDAASVSAKRVSPAFRRCSRLSFRFFRSVVSQAVLLSSYFCLFSARPLRSIRITGLPRYYGPLRLPARAARGYLFPLAVAACCHAAPWPGLPGSWLICPCALPPLTPGSPAIASTHCFIAGFRLHPHQADCPLPSRNEAETGLLALRLAGSPFEASSNGLLRSHARLATCRMGNLHGEFLSSHKISQAWPGAPDNRRLKTRNLSALICVYRRPILPFFSRLLV